MSRKTNTALITLLGTILVGLSTWVLISLIELQTIVAMMQQDSSLGTAGYGAKSMNPGNVKSGGTADNWAARDAKGVMTDSGGHLIFNNWQGGVFLRFFKNNSLLV